MPVALHLLDPGDAFGVAQGAIRDAVQSGIAWVSDRAPVPDIALVVYPTDFGRDFRFAAHASGPHNAIIGIDCAVLAAPNLSADLRRTTIHELHHCLRWPHVPHWTVGEACILEGLALLADEQARPPDHQQPTYPVADPDKLDRDFATQAPCDMEDARGWLYTCEPGTPDNAPFRIYTAGRRAMVRALARLDMDPWQALALPADILIAAASAGPISESQCLPPRSSATVS